MQIENHMPQAKDQVALKVLGPGCKRCALLESHVKQALERMGKALEVQKITDIPEILAYGVVQTPALVLGEEVLITGFVPSPRQIQEMLEGKI